MKKRLSIVCIGISFCIVLAGCQVTNQTQENAISSQEIFSYDISTEPEDSAHYQDNIYISRFSKEDDYLLSANEDFYERIAWNPIEQKHVVDGANSTWDAVQSANKRCEEWNQQIDYTSKRLSELLSDSNKDKLHEAVNLWDEYSQEKVSFYQRLFGTNGMIPGSMYTQIAADILADDNRLIAFALMSLEYELSQEVQFEMQTEDSTLNPENINWYDISEECACVEYSQDFKEMLDAYSLVEKNSEELEALICETSDRIQEIIGDDFDVVSHVNKYVSFLNMLSAIEEQVSTDNRHITVKEQRLKLYATQLLNIEFMLLEYRYF